MKDIGGYKMTRVTKYSVCLVKDSSANYPIDKMISSPDAANSAIQTILGLNNATVEKFGFLALDIKNKIIGIHIVSVGSINSSIVHPREVFKAAILNNAARIIIFHNHPSGDPTPSPEDINVTKRICEAGEIIGIELIDHIIVGDTYYSLKEHGRF
jgi:DNA repair protein RadC